MYRLLIVDDEQIERDALRYIINKNCLSIGEIRDARNGREAVDVAAEFRPHILFMDIRIPGMNGLDATREIRRMLPDVAVVFLTAFDYFDYAHEAIKIGVKDFIIKPAEDERIMEVVARITAELDAERTIREKMENDENRLELVTDYLEAELVFDLVMGELPRDQIAAYLKMIGTSLGHTFAAVAEIDYATYPMKIASPVQETVLKRRFVLKVSRAVIGAGYRLLSNIDHLSMYLWLVSDAPLRAGETDLLHEALEEIVRDITRELSFSVRIGVSEPTAELAEMHHAFRHARAALSVNESGTAVSVHNEDREKSIRRGYPAELERSVISRLGQGDLEGALVAADGLFDWIEAASTSDRMRNSLAYELVTVIAHALSASAGLTSLLGTESTAEIFSAENSWETRRWIIASLRMVHAEVLRLAPGVNSGSAMDTVGEYLQRNFSRQIGLESVAELVGLSPYYLSKVFKEHFGVNFVEFVTRLRMDEACRLLSSPDYNVKEVSGMVGYNDPNYFARVFKRWFGESPSRYRGKKMLQS